MQKTFRKWQKTSKNYIININNRNFPSSPKFPHFRKNIQNSFQKGLKARPMSAQGERSEPWGHSEGERSEPWGYNEGERSEP